MTTAFRESWKAPWIKLLLQGPGVSAASGDENTIENSPSIIFVACPCLFDTLQLMWNVFLDGQASQLGTT